MAVDPIRTERLELVSFSPEMMQAVVDGDLESAGALLGATFPAGAADELRDFFRARIADLAADPASQQWLARAIVTEDGGGARVVAGSLGFHGPPDPEGRAEIGYQIEPEFRRRGLTSEAVRGLLDWAVSTHGIDRFRASIAPANAASIGLIERLGFVRVGPRMDEVDGGELVYELDGWAVVGRG